MLKCIFCNNEFLDHETVTYVCNTRKCVCKNCWHSLSNEKLYSLLFSGKLQSMLKEENSYAVIK